MHHNVACVDEARARRVMIDDPRTGLRGVIVVDSTARGPAAGGCRLWRYETADAMIRDAERLARGMSYKNALAGLPFGGGKAVLNLPDGPFDRAAIFRVFADAVASLDGAYITAEDVGTSIADMEIVRERTPYVAGLDAQPGKAGGDPSPWTALGVFQAMQAATRWAMDREIAGLTVAVQGVGNVGANLCRLVKQAGGHLILADIDGARAARLAEELGADVAGVDAIHAVKADIFAPCALGAVLNAQTVPQLQARLVCGGANNQLATEGDGDALLNRDIVYCPDYLVNAGGIINVAAEYLGETTDQVADRIGQIPHRLTQVLTIAAHDRQPPHLIADQTAQQLIAAAQ